MNLFAYVGGDPINLIDPKGLEMIPFWGPGTPDGAIGDAWQQDVNDVMRYNEEVKKWLDKLKSNMSECCLDADFYEKLSELFRSIPPTDGGAADLTSAFLSEYFNTISVPSRKCEEALRKAINEWLKKYPAEPQLNYDYLYPPYHAY